MIDRTTAAYQRSEPPARYAPAAEPDQGFELELAAEREIEVEEPEASEPEDDQPDPDAALAQALQDPRARVATREPAAAPAPTLGPALAHASALATAPAPAPALAPDPDPAPAPALTADLAAFEETVELAEIDISALIARGVAKPPVTVPSIELAAPLETEIDLDELGMALDADAPAEDLYALDLRTPRAPDAPQPVQRLDAARPLADQLADAVHKLASEVGDRPDVMRFRGPDFSFAAVIRQDGSHTFLRLVSDDPNTRAFLGERLPEVRQALERVGFASLGLSVAADADRRRQEPAEPFTLPPDDDAPAKPPPVTTPTDAPRPRGAVDLIL